MPHSPKYASVPVFAGCASPTSHTDLSANGSGNTWDGRLVCVRVRPVLRRDFQATSLTLPKVGFKRRLLDITRGELIEHHLPVRCSFFLQAAALRRGGLRRIHQPESNFSSEWLQRG